MGYKSVREAIRRFEEREREELGDKNLLIQYLKQVRYKPRLAKNLPKVMDKLKKTLKEQLKTYRYARFSCHVLKKEINKVSEEKEYAECKDFFDIMQDYVESIRKDSQKKIPILKEQEKILHEGLNIRNLDRLLDLYRHEISITFDIGLMKQSLKGFMQQIQTRVERLKQKLQAAGRLTREAAAKLDNAKYTILMPFTNILNIGIMRMERHAVTIFAALTITSEVIALIRAAYPQYYGPITAVKIAVDMPKEMLRQSAGMMRRA